MFDKYLDECQSPPSDFDDLVACASPGCNGALKSYGESNIERATAGVAGWDPGLLLAEKSFNPVPNQHPPLGKRRACSPDSQDTDIPREVTLYDDGAFPLDCTLDENSSNIVRRIHELESALRALQSSRDQVAKEIGSLRAEAVGFRNGTSQLEGIRKKVDHFEWIIHKQAKQIAALSTELAKELKSLEQCLAADEDGLETDHMVADRRPLLNSRGDSLALSRSRHASDSHNFSFKSELNSSAQVSRSFSKQSTEDVLELFDVVPGAPGILADILGAKDVRPWKNENRLLRVMPGARASSDQPSTIPEDEMPIFDGQDATTNLPMGAVLKTTVSGISHDVGFYEVNSFNSDHSIGTANSSSSTMASAGSVVQDSRGSAFILAQESRTAQRHGSRSARPGEIVSKPESPFWKLAKTQPEVTSCKVLGNSFDCSSMNPHLDAKGVEIQERDILPMSVQLESREQKLEFRDFLIETVANGTASSMYLLYDVEADPPKYARPPPSAPVSPNSRVSKPSQLSGRKNEVLQMASRRLDGDPKKLELERFLHDMPSEAKGSPMTMDRDVVRPDGFDGFRAARMAAQSRQPLMMPRSMEHGSDDEPSIDSVVASTVVRSDSPKVRCSSGGLDMTAKQDNGISCDFDIMEV